MEQEEDLELAVDEVGVAVGDRGRHGHVAKVDDRICKMSTTVPSTSILSSSPSPPQSPWNLKRSTAATAAVPRRSRRSFIFQSSG